MPAAATITVQVSVYVTPPLVMLAVMMVDVFRFQRARTFARIRDVFPDKPDPEVRRIAVFSLANILQNAIEMIRAPRLTKKWVTTHVRDMPIYAERLRATLSACGRGHFATAVAQGPERVQQVLAALAANRLLARNESSPAVR